MPFEPETEEPFEEAGVGQAASLPELGVHTDLGEARDGIELIDVKPPASSFEEEIDASHALAFAGSEGRHGCFPNGLHDAGGQASGDIEDGPAGDVHAVLVVEFAVRDDLAGERCFGRVVAQDAAFEFAAPDAFFDEDLPVVSERELDCGPRRRAVRDLGDTDARAEIRRLHEERQPELAPDGAEDGARVPPPGGLPDDAKGDDRHARGLEQDLHHGLVHAHCGAEDPRPDEGDVGHLEEPLDGAVLSVRSVEHGEIDVRPDRRGGLCPGPGQEIGGRTGGQPFDRQQGRGDSLPAAALVDVDRGDAEFLRVKVAKDSGGRADRNLVLRGAASEEQGDSRFLDQGGKPAKRYSAGFPR